VAADRQWLKQMLKKRTASSFQLFVKDTPIEDIKDIRERSIELSKRWKALPSETRLAYEERSRQLKVQRDEILLNLPDFKKKQLDRARRECRKKHKQTHPPKPPNPYILYQQQLWKMEQEQPTCPAYNDFVKIAGQRWKMLSSEAKVPFIEASHRLRTTYFQRRDEAAERMRLIKVQQNLAKEAINQHKKNLKNLKNHNDQHTSTASILSSI
jgi:hypothetical protein